MVHYLKFVRLLLLESTCSFNVVVLCISFKTMNEKTVNLGTLPQVNPHIHFSYFIELHNNQLITMFIISVSKVYFPTDLSVNIQHISALPAKHAVMVLRFKSFGKTYFPNYLRLP